jgi:hypothetical protein
MDVPPNEAAPPPPTTTPKEPKASPALALLGRNLLWALGSLAGAVAGAVVCLIVFFIGGLAVSMIGQYVFQTPDIGAFSENAGAFAAAAGVLIGGVVGSILPLTIFAEGEQRIHEKLLAIALVITILVVAWRINSDVVFSGGWPGLMIIVVGVGILAAVIGMIEGKRS